jgi:hypothetical protein
LDDAGDDCDQVIVTFCHISVDLEKKEEEKFVSDACSDGGKHVEVEITTNEVGENEEKHVGNVGIEGESWEIHVQVAVFH